MRIDLDNFSAVGDSSVRHQNFPRGTRFPFGFLRRVAPELPSEFRFDKRLPQFPRRCANVGYVNELVCLHRITFFSVFWFWFVRDLFLDRSTPEGGGVRICQSNARRSHATAAD